MIRQASPHAVTNCSKNVHTNCSTKCTGFGMCPHSSMLSFKLWYNSMFCDDCHGSVNFLCYCLSVSAYINFLYVFKSELHMPYSPYSSYYKLHFLLATSKKAIKQDVRILNMFWSSTCICCQKMMRQSIVFRLIA